MAQIDVVVIGASAGGLQALIEIFEGLPAALRSSLLVAVHTMSDGISYLPQILSKQSRLPIAFAAHDAPIEPGHIYIAPPDSHLVVTGGRKTMLSHGPKENGFRPAVDPLFRTAARAYGSAVMGVILSGALDDGTYGLKVIKELGGTAVVQDPAEATQPGMILSAQRFVQIDHVLPAKDIAALIVHCCGAGEGEHVMARPEEPEPQDPNEETDVEEMEEDFGAPSGLTCPDCGGAIWEIENGKLTRYRCHVGHQYTPEGFDAGQREAVEAALWTAVRVLEERSELRTRMARRAEESGMANVAQNFIETAGEAEQQAHTIRELLFGRAQQAPPSSSQSTTTARRKPTAQAQRRRR